MNSSDSPAVPTHVRRVRLPLLTAALIAGLALAGCSDPVERAEARSPAAEAGKGESSMSATRGDTGQPNDPDVLGSTGMFASGQPTENTGAKAEAEQELKEAAKRTAEWDGSVAGQPHESAYTTETEENNELSADEKREEAVAE